MKKVLLAGLGFVLSVVLNAQFVLSGKVIDGSSGSPIEFAVVHLHETDKYSITDQEGYFRMPDLRTGHYHLHVTCIGYEARAIDIEIKSDQVLDLTLMPSTLEIAQVIVEDSYLKSESRNRSLSVDQVRKDDLLSGSSGNLSEALANIPGIRAISVGTGIAKPVIRGLSGNRILVNDQGIKQEGQQWGNDHGLEMDPFSVERMEIIKGPASLLYGSDGLGGVLNVLPAPIASPHTWNAELVAVGRENDRSIGSSIQFAARGEKWFGAARVSLRDYADLTVPDSSFTYLSRLLPLHDNRLKNTAGRDRSVKAEVGRIGEKAVLRWSFSRFEQQAGLFPGIFGIPDLNTVADDGDQRNIGLPRQEVTHTKLILNGNLHRINGWIAFDVAWQHNLRAELAVPHAHGLSVLPTSEEALSLNLQNLSANFRRHWRSGKGWKWVAGSSASGSLHQRGGWEYLIPDYTSMQLGAFITAEQSRSDVFTWNWGIRGDFGVISSESFSEMVLDPDLQWTSVERSPSVDKQFCNISGGAGFSWDLSARSNLKFNLGKSFRVPNVAELASNGVHHGTFRHELGDPSLRAEQGYQMDLSFGQRAESWMYRFTPFLNYFDGFIYLRPSGEFSFLPEAGQVYIYTQHNALFSGAEIFADWHPVDPVHVELASDVVFSYNTETGLPLPFTPPVRNRLTISWESEGRKGPDYEFGGSFISVMAQNMVDRNEDPTPGYQLFNLFLRTSWVFRSTSLNVRLNAQNIFNTAYLDHLSRYRQINLPAAGRNISLSIQVPFSGVIKTSKPKNTLQ